MTRGGARTIRGHHYARARFGRGERVEVRVPWAKSQEEAAERGQIIAELADALVEAGRRDLVRGFAKELAAAHTPKRLATVRAAIAAVVKGAIKAGAGRDITIRQWGDRYVSGELARLHPDHVRKKDWSDDRARLDKYVYPRVGDVPVAAFTVAHAELVMKKLPEHLAPATRRHVAQIMGRLLHLAVWPGQLIPASPLPRLWIPKLPKAKRHYTCLWPREEQLLLESDPPLVFRLFVGVLDREGMRIGELLESEWWQWNLTEGTFTATKTKTGDPRMWAIRPDVARAMRRWKKLCRPANDNERPFAAIEELVHRTKLADALRVALKAAGVTRAELFDDTEHTAKLRAHDMRATFVTLSLAEGKSDTWIRDRTGHKSTSMIDRYRRAARQVTELKLGGLVDLEATLWRGGGLGGDRKSKRRGRRAPESEANAP